MATLGLFLLGVGEIKKLGGVRTHGSHVFKNSLAGSRLGPEHGCSGPVMLTQHTGALRLPLLVFVTPSTAQQPLTPTGAQPRNHPGQKSYQILGASKDTTSTVWEHTTTGKEHREVFAPQCTWLGMLQTGERRCCARASTNLFCFPGEPARTGSSQSSAPNPRNRRTTGRCAGRCLHLSLPHKADCTCRSQSPCRSLAMPRPRTTFSLPYLQSQGVLTRKQGLKVGRIRD